MKKLFRKMMTGVVVMAMTMMAMVSVFAMPLQTAFAEDIELPLYIIFMGDPDDLPYVAGVEFFVYDETDDTVIYEGVSEELTLELAGIYGHSYSVQVVSVPDGFCDYIRTVETDDTDGLEIVVRVDKEVDFLVDTTVEGVTFSIVDETLGTTLYEGVSDGSTITLSAYYGHLIMAYVDETTIPDGYYVISNWGMVITGLSTTATLSLPIRTVTVTTTETTTETTATIEITVSYDSSGAASTGSTTPPWMAITTTETTDTTSVTTVDTTTSTVTDDTTLPYNTTETTTTETVASTENGEELLDDNTTVTTPVSQSGDVNQDGALNLADVVYMS